MKARNAILYLVTAGAVGTITQASITGSLWEGPNASVPAAPASVPVSTPDVTFSVDSPLNFDSRASGSGYTIGGWLATGGATILTGAGKAGDSMNNTLIQFLGTVSVVNGQTFSVTHDDGLTLVIGAFTVISAPGPTAPTLTTATYTGPTGNFPFELVYGENSGPPGVLKVDLPFEPIPEPTTLLAGALLLLPVGAAAIRSMRHRKCTA